MPVNASSWQTWSELETREDDRGSRDHGGLNYGDDGRKKASSNIRNILFWHPRLDFDPRLTS